MRCFPFYFCGRRVDVNLYTYDGPVMEFERCIHNRWHASTYAVSEKKARSNLIYQYKKSHNKTPNSKISLPGKVVMVPERSYILNGRL